MSKPNGETPKERFDAQKRAAGIMEPADWWVYILELKPDDEGVPKYYVGHTKRLQQRIHDHMTGVSCAWVRRFGVLTVLDTLRTTEEGALGLEIAKCTELKVKFGWDNVRGGWITIQENLWLPCLDTGKRRQRGSRRAALVQDLPLLIDSK